MSSSAFQRGVDAVLDRLPEGVDAVFDRLPDDIVFVIFNKVHDAKSLCLSLCVCKRFYSIIPEVDTVSLSMSRPIKKNQQKPSAEKSQSQVKKSFKNVVGKVVAKPFKYVRQLLKSMSESCDSNAVGYYGLIMPSEALESFGGIRNIELILPSTRDKNDSYLLKWKGEFGSKLHSSLLLYVPKISKVKKHQFKRCDEDCDCEGSGETSVLMTDRELRTTLFWNYHLLTSASTSHRLFQVTLEDHQTLQNVIITDERKIRTFRMNSQQIEEFKKSVDSGEWSKNELDKYFTNWVPSFKMKIWYLPKLKLSGRKMKGATLVMIKPIEEGNKEVEESSDWVVKAFDGEGEKDKVSCEVVRKLLKKKPSYIREMNSFFKLLPSAAYSG